MKLSKYLADYIEHEKWNFVTMEYAYGDASVIIDADDLQETIQQGIEAFESTEASKVLVVSEKQRDKRTKEFGKEWNHFCDCIDFGKSFLDADAIRFMNEIGLRIRELSE